MRTVSRFILKIMLIVTIFVTNFTNVSAISENQLSKDVELSIDAYENLMKFETTEGFDTLEILKEMKKDFQEIVKSSEISDVQYNQYVAQINGLEQRIKRIKRIRNLYLKLGNSKNVKEFFRTNINEYIDIFSSLSSRPQYPLCETHKINSDLIIAWFNVKGYKLSAELLNYSFVNTQLLSNYIPNPLNTNQIRSTTFFQTYKVLSVGNNNQRFTSGDLYYAIHRFRFYYSYDFGSLKYMVIKDDYDFAKDTNYVSLAGLATTAMYDAQQSGCLIPFTTTINLPTN